MKYPFISLLLVLIFSACNSEKASNSQASDIRDQHTDVVKRQYDEVIRIHDEAMIEMSTMRKYRKNLLSHGSSDEILDACQKLIKADESMMDWMAQFKMPEKVSQQEKMSFLNRQFESVSNMSEEINSAMEHAEALLEKLGADE